MNAIAIRWFQDHNRRYWLTLFWMLMTIIATPAVRADIYFWQDGQGVIHFSNQEAPPSSSLYMREPASIVSEPARDAGNLSKTDDVMQAKLARTHRKLEGALERVDDLAEEVRVSQQAAAVAAALARQAAEMSAANASPPAAQLSDGGERGRTPVVVHYAVPYGYKTIPRYDPHRQRHYQGKPYPSRFSRLPKFSRHHPNHRKTIRIYHKARPKAHLRSRLSKSYKDR